MAVSQSSSSTSTTVPVLMTATLFMSTSSLPYRWTAASTIARQSSELDTSASNTDASPPSSAMMADVSSARPASRSTSSTRAPSRANSTDVALPVPYPGPLEPAPVTIATLPSSRALPSAMSDLRR